LSQLAGGENGGRTSIGQALESIDFQGISQFMIISTEISLEKIWLMTSVETPGYSRKPLRGKEAP
jgi:hypothetical protein